MKKFFKAALLTMLFTACIGLTALADNEAAPAAATGGDAATPGTTTSGNSGASSSANSGSKPTADYNKDLNGMISGTPEGDVIRITKEDGRDSLDLDMVKRIVNRNLTLVMEYTYNGADFRIVIPGNKAVIDESVPIYGPLYLAAHYSSSAAVGGSSNGVTYTIAKGDTLSKIAATNGTTVAALAALNPQIKDINVIYTGQNINLK